VPDRLDVPVGDGWVDLTQRNDGKWLIRHGRRWLALIHTRGIRMYQTIPTFPRTIQVAMIRRRFWSGRARSGLRRRWIYIAALLHETFYVLVDVEVRGALPFRWRQAVLLIAKPIRAAA